MNLSQRTSLSLLFLSLSTVSANAALSGDSGSAGMSIETASNNSSLQPLDQLLDGGNNADLFGSVMQQHATAAQPAISTMDGHFGGAGAEQPAVFDQKSPTGQIVSAGQTMPSAPATPAGEAPNLSLTVAVRTGITAQTDSTSALASFSSPSSPASGGSFVPTGAGDTTITTSPVPLPAAGLLFASGLVAFPAMRRKRQE